VLDEVCDEVREIKTVSRTIIDLMDDWMSFVAADNWVKQLTLPQPLATRVQAWLVPLESSARLALAQPLLSPAERGRGERFATEAGRRGFILSHGALRCILSGYTRSDPSELRFAYTPRGKPFLDSKNAAGIHFNLSHSGDLALIAVAVGRRVGVDLELVQERSDAHEIARTYWAAAEQHALRQVPPAEQCRTFYRLWTRKEAVLKASGQGITDGLRAPDVSVGLRVEVAGSRWLLFDLDPAPEYVGALALEDVRTEVITAGQNQHGYGC
jgi:4'-phosphopantetheinyl transferase